MPDYWIADINNRILGPVTLEVVRDLVNSGQMREIAHVSRDGKKWGPVEQHPEVQSIMAARGTNAAAGLAQQATRVREYLAQIRQQSMHEVLRVDRNASLDKYRAAFFGLVKRFYPDRLPPEAPGELRAACEDTFLFLAGQMVQVERTHPQTVNRAPQRPPTLTLAAAATPAAAVPPKPLDITAPTYAINEFIGLERRAEDRVEAKIRVNATNLGIFTDHPLTNISMGGLFIPALQSIPLDTSIDLALTFPDGKEIKVRGKVVWENAAGKTRGKPVGFGVRFSNLTPADRDFIKAYIDKNRPKP